MLACLLSSVLTGVFNRHAQQQLYNSFGLTAFCDDTQFWLNFMGIEESNEWPELTHGCQRKL